VTEYKVVRVDPSKLKPHPANSRIYGDTDTLDEDFVESVKSGILEPLLATGEMTVISGHRRRKAAMEAGLKDVPVVVRPDLTDPLDIEEALILANKQRVKGNEQKAREFKRLKEIEAKRAASRKGRRKSGDRVPKKNTGRSADIAAKVVGMASSTATKAAYVVEEIDKAKASGDKDTANKLSSTLKSNVSAAHRQAKSSPKTVVRSSVPTGVIPPGLHETFNARTTYRSLIAKIGSIRKEVLDLALEEGGERILIQNVRVEIKNLLEVLHAATPFAVCPYCKGSGCGECESYGWMTKERYSGIPEERR